MYIIIGLALIAVGVYFFLVQFRKSGNDLVEIQFQQTKSIPDALEAVKAMEDIDPNYREFIELKGFADCKNPQTTPYSQKKVAFYTAEVHQLSEETREETDNNGNRRTNTYKHDEKLSEEESGEPLLLRDNDGNEIIIETNGVSGSFDMPKTLDRFQSANGNNGYSPFMNPNRHFTQFNINMNFGNGYRLLGYKQIENTINLRQPLYVLGEAYMNCGQLFIGPPREKGKSFIVSTKSEEELIKNKKNSKMMAIVLGCAAIVIGIAMIVMNFTK